MRTYQIPWEDVFEIHKNGISLKTHVYVYKEYFKKGTFFKEGEKMSGVNFHLFRHFDLAVRKPDKESFRIVGFFIKD